MGRFIGVYILDIGYEQMPLFARQGGGGATPDVEGRHG